MIVRCAGLAKQYRAPARVADLLRGRLSAGPVPALADINLEVGAGEVVAVLGPNGSGKSTLLKCLAGLVAPSAGTAVVCGHDCRRGGAALRALACYVGADARSFVWSLTGRENLEFFAALHGYASADAHERVASVLDQVGLAAQAADRPVAGYSSGMRQRLSLARGFLGEPRLFLLDEPTSGLDPRAAREHRSFIASLASEGRTVIIATHMLEEARELGSRAIVLESGRVRYAGPFGVEVEAAFA